MQQQKFLIYSHLHHEITLHSFPFHSELDQNVQKMRIIVLCIFHQFTSQSTNSIHPACHNVSFPFFKKTSDFQVDLIITEPD